MRKPIAAGLGFALASALLVGCGSGESSSGADRPKGEPLKIGMLAPVAGQAAYPGTLVGLDAAEEHINGEMGGINGRPIEFDICKTDGTPEVVIDCANRFVSKNVPLVFDAVDFQSNSAGPILSSAKIPVYGPYNGANGLDAADYGTSFYVSGPASMTGAASVQLLQRSGVKKAALALPENPQNHKSADFITGYAKSLGIGITPNFVDISSLNPRVLAATQLSSKPDAVGVLTLPDDKCTALFKAVRQQGFDGKLIAGPCTSYVDELGADAAGSLVQNAFWPLRSKKHAPERVKKQLDAYVAALEGAGRKEDDSDVRSTITFATLVTLAEILVPLKEITAASVTDALKSLRDHETWLFANMTCDGKQWPGSPGSCSAAQAFFEIQADGSAKPLDPKGHVKITPAPAG